MRAVILGLICISLTACSGGDRSLRNLDVASDGPDEFSVVPSAPLVMPETDSLPAPTPGQGNRTDVNPIGDAIAALGGRERSAGGVPASDAGLVAFASRNGVTPNIRAELAEADAAFRSRATRFSWNPFSRKDRYFSAYARQALDAYAELARFRSAGVQTPSAPPE